MDRRTFIKYGAVGVAGASAAPVLGGCGRQVETASSTDLHSFELEEMTIADLQEGMEQGRFTAQSIAEAYMARIESVDRQGPSTNAVIELNPDALAIAKQLDQERAEGRVRGPMHGIPVLLKDNIDTADRMHTTAGSLALAGWIPQQDAFLVRRLREAGALILGKTNLSEWANFRSTRSTSGWSGRGGQTRNPYVLDRNPCGSSSGSGVAVAANLAAVAVGTETDGSIICPSSTNGVAGIKPTLGLISRSGIIPIAHSQDTAGPMARTVTDAAILLGAMTGTDPDDLATRESEGNRQADYTSYLVPDGLRGARIGVARNFFGFHPIVDRLMEVAIEDMRQLGAEIIDPANITTVGGFNDSEFEVLLYEFKSDLNDYLGKLAADMPVHSLRDLIAYNEENEREEMPYFGQEIFLMAEEKGPLTSEEYRNALAKNHRLSREEGIDAVIRQYGLDAIIAPAGGPAWVTDLVNGDHYGGGSSSPAAVAGYPNVTVPAGFVFRLPIGISFIGTAWSEPVLLRLAYAYEQATQHRKTPEFLPSLDMQSI